MLKLLSEYITYSLLRLQHGTHIADAIEFFIYDTLKIFILLSVIIFAVSIIRSYFQFMPEGLERGKGRSCCHKSPA